MKDNSDASNLAELSNEFGLKSLCELLDHIKGISATANSYTLFNMINAFSGTIFVLHI
jgi:hypothetical protein